MMTMMMSVCSDVLIGCEHPSLTRGQRMLGSATVCVALISGAASRRASDACSSVALARVSRAPAVPTQQCRRTTSIDCDFSLRDDFAYYFGTYCPWLVHVTCASSLKLSRYTVDCSGVCFLLSAICCI